MGDDLVGFVGWWLAGGSGADVDGGQGVACDECFGEGFDGSERAQDDAVGVKDGMRGADQRGRHLFGSGGSNHHAMGFLQGEVEGLKQQRHRFREFHEPFPEQAQCSAACFCIVLAFGDGGESEQGEGGDGISRGFRAVIVFFDAEKEVLGVCTALPESAGRAVVEAGDQGIGELDREGENGGVQGGFVEVQSSVEQAGVVVQELGLVAFAVAPAMIERAR